MEAAQMIQGLHGGDVLRIASELQCQPSEIIDFSANINPRGLPASVLTIMLHSVLAISMSDVRMRY
jgi:threonine-phosphate decarboxylase